MLMLIAFMVYVAGMLIASVTWPDVHPWQFALRTIAIALLALIVAFFYSAIDSDKG